LAGRDAVHVGLLHYGRQRPLAAAPRLEQTREGAPRPHFREPELEGPQPRRPAPLRYAARSPLRSYGSAPTRAVTSASISACASTRPPSRRTSACSSARSLPTNAERSILPLAIASSPTISLAQRSRVEDVRWPFSFPRRPQPLRRSEF